MGLGNNIKAIRYHNEWPFERNNTSTKCRSYCPENLRLSL